MLARCTSGVVHGIEGEPVDVEVHTGSGLPGLLIVGRPGASVRESAARIRAAIVNSGFTYPRRRIVVNLAPADLPKNGGGLDLPLALALLATSREGSLAERLAHHVVLGEVALDGSVRPVRGVLPLVLATRDRDLEGLLVPEANAGEAAVVAGRPVIPVRSLLEAVAHLEGSVVKEPHEADPEALLRQGRRPGVDLSFVRGQEHAKRALLISAAGEHNLLMIGPPGCGKTLLARCLPGLLPPLRLEEAIETTAVHSVAGHLLSPLVTARPFRAPHHTVSVAGFLGGGSELRPGEVSLAHNGVLFLDEALEFPRRHLDLLRQPLEEERYVLTRRSGSRWFPSRIVLALATNA
jgi:magnesium chelatase family protein